MTLPRFPRAYAQRGGCKAIPLDAAAGLAGAKRNSFTHSSRTSTSTEPDYGIGVR